ILPAGLLRPVRQRIDLDEIQLRIPCDDRRLSPMRTLIAADRADPGVEPAYGALQRLDLADAATLVRPRPIDRPSESRFHLIDRFVRLHVGDLDAVPLLESVAHIQR